MKRSEMLKKLTYVWLDLNYSEEEAVDIVRSVLIEVEKAGMLPPARIGALVGLDGIPVHAWEPEEDDLYIPVLPIGISKVADCPVVSASTHKRIGISRGDSIEEIQKRIMETHADTFKKLAENEALDAWREACAAEWDKKDKKKP